MPVTGNKSGNYQVNVNCAGISASMNLPFLGSASPPFGINAPAALSGTVLSQGGDTLTVADPGLVLAAQTVAVFWYVLGVLHAVYDIAVSSVTSPGAAETVALDMTGAKYLVSGDTGLPANATAITVAVAQDVTDGVSITGANLQQLLATSSQPGIVEWLDATPATQRVSTISAAQGLDTWPSGANQAQPWTDTVVKIRCYNAGTSSANMQAGAILA
ncbi:MAG: hypothetical protein ACLQLG_18590 [Thermoguttaceae bacterium]